MAHKYKSFYLILNFIHCTLIKTQGVTAYKIYLLLANMQAISMVVLLEESKVPGEKPVCPTWWPQPASYVATKDQTLVAFMRGQGINS